MPGSAETGSTRRRRSQFRAALLAMVWMLPGVWCAAHGLAHAIDSGHHELHLTGSTNAGIPAMSCDHDDGHSHPEVPPALSTEGVKKLDASVLLTAAAEIEASKATLHLQEDNVLGSAARRAAAVSGPRAPPIS